VTIGSLAAGASHTCELTLAGGVYCWGSNGDGQLGNGTTTNSEVPLAVNGLSSGVAVVAAGGFHSCARLGGGGVQCWGNNLYGQLGDGTTAPSSVPVEVNGLASGVASIAAGDYHTCALTQAGGVLCWGSNGDGQLGDGTTTSSPVPVPVSGLASGAAAIAAGSRHTCALTGTGGVRCWGYNQHGQLGNGTTTNSPVPVDVSGLADDVAAIALGAYHSCALTLGGGVQCWGLNSTGQLGSDVTPISSVPVAVTGLASGVAALAAGGFHSFARTTDGGAGCWGFNESGQLGNASNTDSSVPVPVDGLASGVGSIAAGAYHSCAVAAAGRAKCWGSNYSGQLGNDTTTDSNVPVWVVDPPREAPSLGGPALALLATALGLAGAIRAAPRPSRRNPTACPCTSADRPSPTASSRRRTRATFPGV
jgi:alpha-tubulin suppressor-like RCC1 family protein